jgi:hypothetical protein
VGSENFNEKLTHYRRPEFVSQYLRRNDIRPLKKVITGSKPTTSKFKATTPAL